MKTQILQGLGFCPNEWSHTVAFLARCFLPLDGHGFTERMCPLEVKCQCRCCDQCSLVLERPEGDRAPPFSPVAARSSSGMRALGDWPPQGAGAVRPLPSLIPYFGNLHCALETSNHLYLPSLLGLTAFSRIPECCSASQASAKRINTSQEWPSAKD